MKRWLRILLSIVGILLTAAFILPLVIPVPSAGDTLPRESLASEGGEFIQVGDLEVYIQRTGEGEPPLVLLHGFGASLFSWREVIHPLAENAFVVAYDRPGFGLTERPLPPYPQEESPYSTPAQVELVVGLMDSLNIEEAVLVGNSAGGTIALQTALEHPDRITALVLLSPAVYEGGGTPAFVKPLFQLPQIQRLGPLFARNIRTWGQRLLETAWHDPARITQDIYDGYTRPLQVENWDRALWELVLASEQPDLASRMEELSLPVLVITGDDDRVVPTENSIRLAGEIPGAELVVLPGCGHVPQEECPQAFLDAVMAFLQSL